MTSELEASQVMIVLRNLVKQMDRVRRGAGRGTPEKRQRKYSSIKEAHSDWFLPRGYAPDISTTEITHVLQSMRNPMGEAVCVIGCVTGKPDNCLPPDQMFHVSLAGGTPSRVGLRVS